MMKNTLHLIGCASGLAGADEHSGDGPLVMRHSPFLSQLTDQGIPYEWGSMVLAPHSDSLPIDVSVGNTCEELAKNVSQLVRDKAFFSVIGGDHSCAIGTWSGVYDALHETGDIGLIWIDAHMDSHTPETSQSGRIHGMPLACLLGYGYPALTSVLHQAAKLKPENICMIGVRSFESGEAEFLKNLNVKIYFMDEVKERGFATVLQEAVDIVNRHTIGFGLTLDLDAIDPQDAPGVDVPETDGIRVNELYDGLAKVFSDERLITTEIVEFDPIKDNAHLTEKLIVNLLAILAKGKHQ